MGNVAVGSAVGRQVCCRSSLLEHLEPCLSHIRLGSGYDINHRQAAVLVRIFIHIYCDLIVFYTDVYPVLYALHVPLLAVGRDENGLFAAVLGDYGRAGRELHRSEVGLRVEDFYGLAAGGQEEGEW